MPLSAYSLQNQDELKISQRAARVAPILAMDILALAGAKEAKGDSVLHMEVGQPSSPAPKVVLDAARSVLEHGKIGYTAALGIDPLRERIARHYKEAYALDVAPERIVVTTGSSAGFVLTFLGMFDAGQRVAISDPGYPAYRAILKALDVEPVPIPLTAKNRYIMTPEAIEEVTKGSLLHGILTMSPANPSGTMMNRKQLADICTYAQSKGMWYISDEIYHGITYGEAAPTALEQSSDVIVINSFSKYYCMTGWRIGWAVLPERLVRPFERLAQNFYLCPPYISQVAAIAAFEAQDELEIVRAGYAKNRSMLLEELTKIGITRTHPTDGAFYIYADVTNFTDNSLAFCKSLLEETGVAIASGLDFDLQDGNHHVRLSFARSFEECHEAVKRIGSWLKK